MKHHLAAIGILLGVGAAVLPGAIYHKPIIMLVRATGYGALALFGLALALGPLARLWPRRFGRFLPARRAVGIWSAVGATVHLLAVLEWQQKGLLRLFQARYTGYDLRTGETVFYRFGISDHFTAVAFVGLLALAVMLVIALVSSDRAQRLLGSSSWKLVQQQAYTAFLLIAAHILLMKFGGKSKASPHLLAWAPWFIYAVAALQAAGFIHTVARRRRTQEHG